MPYQVVPGRRAAVENDCDTVLPLACEIVVALPAALNVSRPHLGQLTPAATAALMAAAAQGVDGVVMFQRAVEHCGFASSAVSSPIASWQMQRMRFKQLPPLLWRQRSFDTYTAATFISTPFAFRVDLPKSNTWASEPPHVSSATFFGLLSC